MHMRIIILHNSPFKFDISMKWKNQAPFNSRYPRIPEWLLPRHPGLIQLHQLFRQSFSSTQCSENFHRESLMVDINVLILFQNKWVTQTFSHSSCNIHCSQEGILFHTHYIPWQGTPQEFCASSWSSHVEFVISNLKFQPHLFCSSICK